MNKAVKNLLNVGLVLFFIIVFSPKALAETEVIVPPAPTLIAPTENSILGSSQPLFIGLTKSQTSVKIFIDDILYGQTGILTHESGTANFSFKPEIKLSLGWHKAYLSAEDKDGRTGLISKVINFKIELPFPAPTMFKPVVNANTTSARPFIVGLAKNDSKIKIYLDGKLDGEFEVKNHLSGTANFAYKPAKPLSRGSHQVYALAIDQRGKVSIKSNKVTFPVRISAIAQSASEENKPAEASQESNSEAAGAIEKKAGAEMPVFEKIKNLIGTGTKQLAGGWGLINENEQGQGGLKLNLIIFILFLVGVIAWLLWVNRELVKERRERDQALNQTENNPPPDERQDKLL